jgi:hypothetical protein
MNINIIGLVLNVLGALLIFVFGSPFSFTNPDYGIAYKNPSGKEIRIKKISRFFSYLGMFLIIVGFSLQLFSLKNKFN